jgi:Cu/Ag efflux protein CusF
MFENREVSMKLAKLVLTVSLLTGIPSLVWAQQTLTGTVTTIDRINGTIAIQQTQGGTVGASTGGAIEQQYKAPEGSLEKVHAGDRVTFSVTESDGKKTITNIDSK